MDKDFNQKVMDEFRANEGKVGGVFEGAPMLILHAVGAKSGNWRECPLVYTTDGDNYVIIASKGGSPEHPDWYYNLTANPASAIEVGTEKKTTHAREAAGEERQRLFDAMAAKMPNFAEYQRNTERTIPVFVLEPQAG